MNTDQIIQIAYLILGLIIVWVVLKFVLKLAAKVFACGCSVIVALAVLLALWRFLGGQG